MALFETVKLQTSRKTKVAEFVEFSTVCVREMQRNPYSRVANWSSFRLENEKHNPELFLVS